MVVLLLNATVRQKIVLDANDDDEVDCLTPEGDIAKYWI